MKLASKLLFLLLIVMGVFVVTKTPSVQAQTPPPTCGLFEDVEKDDTFFPYIQSLACANVISGYSCGAPPAGQCVPPGNLPYFLPGNSVTRGQLIKMVALGANYTDVIPAGTQTFADVLPNHTFWLYIEQAALHQIITGYACGGTGEPCDAQNRPYFRPFVDTTRSQAVKVVVLAMPDPVLTAVEYTFADVLPDNPFFQYIEYAYSQNLISGYTCGGTGEPCDAQNRPYFRPGVSLTRGQASKVVAIAFNYAVVTPTPPSCNLRSQGDTNCDGAVNSVDYLYYVRHAAGVTQFPAGVSVDVNGDNVVNATDRTIIVNTILGSG